MFQTGYKPLSVFYCLLFDEGMFFLKIYVLRACFDGGIKDTFSNLRTIHFFIITVYTLPLILTAHLTGVFSSI